MEEITLYQGKANWRAYSSNIYIIIFLSILTLGLGLIITIPMTIRLLIEIYTSDYKVTQSRIQVKKGLLTTKIESLELWRVKDISFRQSFLQKITDGSEIIFISQDSSSPTLTLNNFTQKEGLEIFEKLQNCIASARNQRGVLSVSN